MSFSIRFLDEPVPREWGNFVNPQALAEIRIGDFAERTAVPLNFWSEDQYRQQWRDAANKLLENETGQSVFITQFYDPQKREAGYALECWLAYREADTVYIRNSYFPHEKAPSKWDIVSFDPLVDKRDPKDDVSEWAISLEDLRRFQTEA